MLVPLQRFITTHPDFLVPNKMSFSYSIFIRILKSLSLQDQMQALQEERTVLKVANQGLEGPGGWAAGGEHRRAVRSGGGMLNGTHTSPTPGPRGSQHVSINSHTCSCVECSWPHVASGCHWTVLDQGSSKILL